MKCLLLSGKGENSPPQIVTDAGLFFAKELSQGTLPDFMYIGTSMRYQALIVKKFIF